MKLLQPTPLMQHLFNSPKALVVFLLLLCSTPSWAQKKEERFWVDGVCGMCEERIEKALLRTKGVWVADWNVDTHIATVVFNPSKVSLPGLHKIVAAAGHDTRLETATDAAYNKLHTCCKYRDKGVKDQHK